MLNINFSGSFNLNIIFMGSLIFQIIFIGSLMLNIIFIGSVISVLLSDVVGIQWLLIILLLLLIYIEENYLILQDDLLYRNIYMVGEILYNVMLKYGIKVGRFSDKGKVVNMIDCV